MLAVDGNGDPLITVSPPITLTVSYDPSPLPLGMDESTLELRRYDSGLDAWFPW